MNETLLVPMYVEALYLRTSTNVVEEMTDYSNLPYKTPQNKIANEENAYLSQTVLSPPFEQTNLTLKAGVHLHWSLPDALVNGIIKDGDRDQRIKFPLVPNRWLIIRRGGNKTEKQWVVESDYLHPENATADAINILYHPGSGEYKPYRLLGRKLELTQWLQQTNAQYIPELTAIGPFAKVDSLDNEKAAFSGFYPNCRSVFGFHDEEINSGEKPPQNLQYDIIGWYSDASKDYLEILKQEYEKTNFQSFLDFLEQQAGWTVELANNQNFPRRLLCHGSLKFTANSSLSQLENLKFEGKIAVGNTPEEALAVYLAAQLDSGNLQNRRIIEEQLQALQMSDRLVQQNLDFSQQFRQAAHQNGFIGQTKEILWQVVPESQTNSQRINPANAAQGEGQIQVTLPNSIGEQITRVNEAQRLHDQNLAKVASIREQVYADWCKYMRALYVHREQNIQMPQGIKPEIGEKIHSELIKEFLNLVPSSPSSEKSRCNQYGLTALRQQIQLTGELKLFKDEQGEIARAQASAPEFNSSAIRLAEEINQLIDDVKCFNRESRLIASKDSNISIRGHSQLVLDDIADKCLSFDGTQYYQVSGLKNIKSISMWVNIPDRVSGFLLDGRNDFPNSGVNSTNGIGSHWEKMYINGQQVTGSLTWNKIPKNTWIFLHFQSESTLSGTIHLMSNYAGVNCLKGKIASVNFHSNTLSPVEIEQSYRDEIGLVRPSYLLKIVPGSRFWQQSDPVILITGNAVKPTRNRDDERLHDDNLLRCQVLTQAIDLEKFERNTLTTLKQKLDQFAREPKEKIGFREWKDQPWNPFLLDWGIQFCSLRHNTDDNIVQNIQNSIKASHLEQISQSTRTLLIEPAANHTYNPNILKSKYQLRVSGVEVNGVEENGVELTVRDNVRITDKDNPQDRDSNDFESNTDSYSGAAFLSSSAATLLQENLIAYVNKYLLPQFYKDKNIPSTDQTEDFISKNENLNQVNDWYKAQKPPVKTPSTDTALRAYEELRTLNSLAQGLGGFNDELLTYSRTMQLGIEDSRTHQLENIVVVDNIGEGIIEIIGGNFEEPNLSGDFEEPNVFGDFEEPSLPGDFEEPSLPENLIQPIIGDFEEPPTEEEMHKNFLAQVRETLDAAKVLVPDSLLRSPLTLNKFNPLRVGVMRIDGLRLVDTFGRIKIVIDSHITHEIITSQSLTLPFNVESPKNWNAPIYLPPRLAQPARLNFRWLSANQEEHQKSGSQQEQETNDSPTTTPICGWILPNNLDNSLTIYDGEGTPLVIIDRKGVLRAIPGKDLTNNEINALIAKTNPYLKQMVNYLINQKEAFLKDFLTTVNTALENIDPEGFAQNQAISLLVARPLALVRAKVNLELQGIPAVSQNITDFSADICVNTQRNTTAFEKIKFPIRIGEYQQFNDSLVGYWVQNADGISYKDDTFYAPQSCYVPHCKIKTLYENAEDTTPNTPITLEQTLEEHTAQTLVMLVDPRGQINASCGILPAKKISIPPEQYVPALQALAVTFLSAPLLSDLVPMKKPDSNEKLDPIKLSLPEIPGYVWSWEGKEGNTWSSHPLAHVDAQSIFSSPQKIYDGWLKLTRKTQAHE